MQLYRHTVKERGLGADKKRQALELYLEGLGFRSIGRFLRCSHVAVYNWIKSYGTAIEGIRSSTGVEVVEVVEVVEMDEMHTYIGSKKTIVGSGLLLIDMQTAPSTAFSIPAVSTNKRSNLDHSKPTKNHIKQGLSSSLTNPPLVSVGLQRPRLWHKNDTNLPQVIYADNLTEAYELDKADDPELEAIRQLATASDWAAFMLAMGDPETPHRSQIHQTLLRKQPANQSSSW